jgi:hypothetical protein
MEDSMSLTTSQDSTSTGAVTEMASWEGAHRLRTSDGTGSGGDAEWRVTVFPRPVGRVKRRVWSDGEEWIPDRREWCPEMTIWPTWTPGLADAISSGSALQGVHDYWQAAGDRLRDSAKWMATVLGAALAALVGTSPLAGMHEHAARPIAIIIGLGGLVPLVLTLFLVLQVMRPQSVSLTTFRPLINAIAGGARHSDFRYGAGRRSWSRSRICTFRAA